MGKKDKENKSLESVVGDIFKTTDGFFNGNPQINKPRRVAVTNQRKDDGAVVVVKIMSKEGKEEKIGKDYIPDLILKPENHPSLSEDSIVEKKVRFGVKKKNDPNKSPIYPSDMEKTEDKLTQEELKKVHNGVQNDTPQHKETLTRTLKNWNNHFRK